MTRVEDFWIELFGEPIDPESHNIMKGVFAFVDDDEPMAILAAIPTYVLVRYMLRDERGPFQISARLKRSIENLEEVLKRLEGASVAAEERFNGLNEKLKIVENLLYEARCFSADTRRHPPVLKVEPHPAEMSWGYALAPSAMKQFRRQMYGASAACCLATAVITAVLLQFL